MIRQKMLLVLLVLLCLCAPAAMAAESPPEISVEFDRSSVAAGEEITARYEISGTGSYTEVYFRWYVYDEEGNEVDNEYFETTSLSGESTFTPMYGSWVEVDLIVTESSGMEYFYSSERIPVTGDPSIRPEISVEFDRSSVAAGEEITARYEISGAGSYAEVYFRWYVYDEEGNEVDNEYFETTFLSGESTFTPMYGSWVEVDLIITESTGMMYFYASERIPVTSGTSVRPEISVEFDRSSVAAGEEITARYEISGAGSYTEVYFRWYVYDEEGNEVDNEYFETTSLSGESTFTPMYGSYVEVDLIVTESSGMEYFYSSRWVPIIGDEDFLVLPEDMKLVKAEAFRGADCRVLVCPEGLEEIASLAFADCKGLERVVLASADTVIAADAFEGCSGELRFIIPEE